MHNTIQRTMQHRVQRALTIAAPLIGLLLVACGSQTGQERSAAIQSQLHAQGWQSEVIRTPQFDLQAFTNQRPTLNGVLNVYIEGDGYAWVGGQYPSDDPTPQTPLGLELAMAQPIGAVAYLGRPCQYLGAQSDGRCNKTVWTDARFSEEAVAASNAAISQLKENANARQVRLVGYSGGAAIALLVAARRQDVVQIISVAGNLDPNRWSQALHLDPLKGSLDTRAVIGKTSHIPQVALVGDEDQVVPAALTETFAALYPLGHQPKIIYQQGFGHTCCWVQAWPKLWEEVRTQS